MREVDVPTGSQSPSRGRFYIGSAAISWFVVALLIWGTLFYLSLKFKTDGDWFLASYYSAPALLAALLAVLIRNLNDNGIPAWLITPPVFVFVSYIMLRASFR
jgi:hypothetical protein